MITVNWTPVDLNWTVLFKCLEMTFIAIWHYINKTELNYENDAVIHSVVKQKLFLDWCNCVTPLNKYDTLDLEQGFIVQCIAHLT